MADDAVIDDFGSDSDSDSDGSGGGGAIPAPYAEHNAAPAIASAAATATATVLPLTDAHTMHIAALAAAATAEAASVSRATPSNTDADDSVGGGSDGDGTATAAALAAAAAAATAAPPRAPWWVAAQQRCRWLRPNARVHPASFAATGGVVPQIFNVWASANVTCLFVRAARHYCKSNAYCLFHNSGFARMSPLSSQRAAFFSFIHVRAGAFRIGSSFMERRVRTAPRYELHCSHAAAAVCQREHLP